MGMRLTENQVWDQLAWEQVDEVEFDQNAEGQTCQIKINLVHGSALYIKGAGNNPLVFEEE